MKVIVYDLQRSVNNERDLEQQCIFTSCSENIKKYPEKLRNKVNSATRLHSVRTTKR